MCSLVLLIRPNHAWPVILAGNRDEMRDRPWLAPGFHWPDRPEVLAAKDEVGGGSWLGMNEHGVAATVMNRTGSLGPEPGKRSRGELVLEALDHAEAAEAVKALAEVNPGAYRPFNLVVADSSGAYWLRHAGEPDSGAIEVYAVPAGTHMITAFDMDDPGSPRIRAHLPRFRRAAAPDPDYGRWQHWEALLASRDFDEELGPSSAMTLPAESGFGTLSSTLMALPAVGFGVEPVWRFAAGEPGEAAYEALEF